MSSLARTLYTQEQYLALERSATYKSEYLNGQVLAMAGASLEHNTITANFVRVIGNRFTGRPCQVFSSDMRVKVITTRLYSYPDVVAVCGEMQFDDVQRDTLTNPSVIVEVLSSSTEAYDRGEKFAHYRRLSSLTEYVLVAQDRVRVERYLRQPDGWVLTEMSDLDSRLTLTSIDCDISLRDLYDKVEFPPEVRPIQFGAQEESST